MDDSKQNKLNRLDRESAVIQSRLNDMQRNVDRVQNTSNEIATTLGTLAAVITGAASAVLLVRETCGGFDGNSPELVDKLYKLTKQLHAQGAKIEQMRNANKSKADIKKVMDKYKELEEQIRDLNKMDLKMRRLFSKRIKRTKTAWETWAAYTALIGALVVLLTLCYRFMNHSITTAQRQIKDLKTRRQSLISQSN